MSKKNSVYVIKDLPTITYDEKKLNFSEVKTSILTIYDQFKKNKLNNLPICVNLTVRNTFNPESEDVYVTRNLLITLKFREGRDFYSSWVHHNFDSYTASIVVSENAVATKLNFISTVAHEIGHIIYRMRLFNTKYVIFGHKGDTKESEKDYSDMIEELSADAFAISVLNSLELFKLTRISLGNYIKKSNHKNKEDSLIMLKFRLGLFDNMNIDDVKKEFYFTKKVRDHRVA